MNFIVIFDFFDKIRQFFLNIFAFCGSINIEGLAAELRIFFNNVGLVSLPGQTSCRRHTRNAAADNHGGLIDIELRFLQGLRQGHFVNRHADEVPGLFGCQLRVVFVDPGILVADVGHFKKIFIQSRVYERFLKQRFMGFGCTGGNHDTIQILFFDNLGHDFLGILGTGIEIIGGIFHVGQRGRVFSNRRYIHHPCNVDSAVTDEHPDSGSIVDDIDFRDNFRCLGAGVARFG